MFQALVEGLLKTALDPDDWAAGNALDLLTQEIQLDVTKAFQLSRPLVEQHATMFWDSRSYLDFLMRLSELPSLDRWAPMAQVWQTPLVAEREVWFREREELTLQLEACRTQHSKTPPPETSARAQNVSGQALKRTVQKQQRWIQAAWNHLNRTPSDIPYEELEKQYQAMTQEGGLEEEEEQPLYDELQKNMPFLKCPDATRRFMEAMQTLRNTLHSERIHVETEEWFSFFATDYFPKLVTFVRNAQQQSPEVSLNTDNGYESYLKHVQGLKDNLQEWERWYKSWLETLQWNDLPKKEFTTILMNKLKNTAPPVENEGILRECVELENLFSILYKEYFTLKHKMYKDIKTIGREETDRIRRKLDVLTPLLPSTRESKLYKLYDQYIKLDLNMMIDKKKKLKQFIGTNDLLTKCMKETNEYLKNLR